MLVTQSCPTLCDPVDCSLTGSSVLGILQVRILKWVAIKISFFFIFSLIIRHVQESELISVYIDWLSLIHSTPEIRLWSLKRMLCKECLDSK